MRNILNLVTATLMMGWIVSIAVFSIQNIQAVSLRFLLFESIRMPVGVLLAFCVGFGLVLGAIIPIIWQLLTGKGSKRSIKSQNELY
ncbi:LapA family protein [Gloeocapsa sp. PCC 73106]|uniref:LapA family protein n=1 Tax=Gloeocapsa sp. PCC 73106 TaxID=102232 RepID=UPI0002AC9C6A|nr:LapA family protein [Gloeocapsa sp. PCC 73106]ELR96829.1 Protein of unknown function (DUF1049) [Gloeocapsa sp. PCC 73106]